MIRTTWASLILLWALVKMPNRIGRSLAVGKTGGTRPCSRGRARLLGSSSPTPWREASSSRALSKSQLWRSERLQRLGLPMLLDPTRTQLSHRLTWRIRVIWATTRSRSASVQRTRGSRNSPNHVLLSIDKPASSTKIESFYTRRVSEWAAATT